MSAKVVGQGPDRLGRRKAMGQSSKASRRFTAAGILTVLIAIGALLSGCGAPQPAGRAAPHAEVGAGGAAVVPPMPVVSGSPLASASPAPALTPTAGVAPVVLPPIRAAHLVTPTIGWALTDRGLRLTTTGGATWATVTPPGVPAARILGAAFLDAAHGWTVVAGNPDGTQRTGLDLLRSADGGRSWQQATLAGPDRLYTEAPSEAATIDFLDAQHGWIAIRLASSSNFSRGRLFQTTDGGATWQQRTTPIGDPVRFVTPTDGWAAGGPGGGHLYVSRDGGRSWQASTVAAPSAFAKSAVTYSLPTFTDPQTGVLPVTFAGDDATPPGLGFYQTRDGGGSWTLAQVITLDGRLGVGVAARTAVFGPAAWLVARPGASRLTATADGGHSTQEVTSAGLLPNIADLTFADAANGWARAADIECPGAPQVTKGGCRSTPIQLLRTSDGGRTWVPLIP